MKKMLMKKICSLQLQFISYYFLLMVKERKNKN